MSGKYFEDDTVVILTAKPFAGYLKSEIYKEFSVVADQLSKFMQEGPGAANGFIYHGMTADFTLTYNREGGI